MPEQITLSTNLVNGIMQYLGSKPFVEVNDLISAIRAEAQPQLPVQEVPEKEEG